MILGIGIDVCEVARIARALSAPTGTRFRERVFTVGEQDYCEARRRGRLESYAVRFAAKEAAMKALGTGWADGVGWRDFEIVRRPSRAPELVLHGRAAELARARGMERWLVALSHSGPTAVAWVLVEGDAPTPARRRGGGGRSATRRPRARR